jgi:hypothetical protein
MTFQITGLAPEPFIAYFNMTDNALRAVGACRMLVTEYPGTPCRVSLEDAQLGETVLLVNHIHQPAPTPYQASHAIFVRQGVSQHQPGIDEVPEVLSCRLISIRAFDRDHMMVNADVVAGGNLPEAIKEFFVDTLVDYLHLHNAKQGCYAAKVQRA